MKMLIEGLFPRERLLQYIRDFIVFEVVNDKITKKSARYHQFFAARIAAEKTVAVYRRVGAGLSHHSAQTGTPTRPAPTEAIDRRIGVICHTTGSGKSLSMAFLVGILRRLPELENPIFLIEVDRNDLDKQLYDQFVAASQLVGDVKQADSVDDLRSLLQTAGGEVIFTTIEKFRLQEGETRHPALESQFRAITAGRDAENINHNIPRWSALAAITRSDEHVQPWGRIYWNISPSAHARSKAKRSSSAWNGSTACACTKR